MGPHTRFLQALDAAASSAFLRPSRPSHVYLQGGGDDGAEEAEEDAGGRTDLYNDPENPKHFDLLTLRDGTIADLTPEIDIPAGTYGQLRFVVDSAKVTLAEGFFFTDGESTTDVLFVPSGSQSGIKVNLHGAIEADPDEAVTIVVDFDVDANFVIQTNPDGTVRQILFTPVLRELKREEEPAS